MEHQFQYAAFLHRLFCYQVIELIYAGPISDSDKEKARLEAARHWTVSSICSSAPMKAPLVHATLACVICNAMSSRHALTESIAFWGVYARRLRAGKPHLTAEMPASNHLTMKVSEARVKLIISRLQMQAIAMHLRLPPHNLALDQETLKLDAQMQQEPGKFRLLQFGHALEHLVVMDAPAEEDADQSEAPPARRTGSLSRFFDRREEEVASHKGRLPAAKEREASEKAKLVSLPQSQPLRVSSKCPRHGNGEEMRPGKVMAACINELSWPRDLLLSSLRFLPRKYARPFPVASLCRCVP